MLRTSLLTVMLLLSSLALAQEAPEAIPPMPRDRPEGLTDAPPADATAPADAEAEAPEADANAPEAGAERPEGDLDAPEAEQPPADAAPAAQEPAEVAEPAEPPRPYQTQCPAVIGGQIEAKLLPPIDEGECGTQSPLAVTGILVNGRMVPLSSEATLTCEVATTLPQWGEAIDGYLQARENTELASLDIGTNYNCRGRVGGSSDRLSEHGMANALDVVGFTFADGRTVTVEGDWPAADAPEGKFLRFAHDAACSSFSTTLGPEANAEHHDHFHVDMGCHGAACQARLCE
ncbi:extensin family protein [Devosia sp. 1635]|uniref:extensin-like domain-containing protein n=1 Tax=Devosia sp. 1635 TaxID=2726066 RepID=UPI0015647581|nr:extensin family protein [Devosia sp. 1635]